MKVYLSFENEEEIQKISESIIGKNPDYICLPVDGMQIGEPTAPCSRRAKYDNELTVDELAMYEAGRLSVHFNLVTAKFFTLENVAELTDLTVDELKAIRSNFYDEYGIPRARTVQRDAIINVKQKEREKDEN